MIISVVIMLFIFLGILAILGILKLIKELAKDLQQEYEIEKGRYDGM